MRLQLRIQRHSLPQVAIIYTTGTGPSSHTKSRDATIADLLSDVNDLVPLESSDGEWGLEDYVVELAATADQELTYECLHFQTIETVLREDDEVVIRALSNEDLRVRRLGKRHQITNDGRHMIDGVPFGKQWLRKTTRPEIIIPPRKKRRLLEDEDSNLEADDDVQRIFSAADSYDGAPVPVNGDVSDDEGEDDDYVDNDATKALQVIVKEAFEDADKDSDEDDEQLDAEVNEEELIDELKYLLENSTEEEATGGLTLAEHLFNQQQRQKRKRKRDINDEGEPEDDDDFEGFSSSATPHLSAFPNGSNNVLMNGGPESEEDSNDDEDESDDWESDSDSDSSSEASNAEEDGSPSAFEKAKQRALNLVNGATDPEASEESDNDNSEESSSSGLESESNSQDSLELDTSSESDSGFGSEVESPLKPPAATPSSQSVEKAIDDTIQASTKSEPPSKPRVGIPFQGSMRTKNNNNRAKRKKTLVMLKQQGLLHEDANFKDLAQYEATQAAKDAQGQIQTELENAVSTTSIEPVIQESGVAVHEAMSEEGKENVEPRHALAPPQQEKLSVPTEDATEMPETSQVGVQTPMEPSPKRQRLDVASTRRLVFGSLGLRTPKTPEESQKLRDKLANNIRQSSQRKLEADVSPLPVVLQSTTDENDEAWRDRLIISAVECEGDGGVLPPPPFPFQQGWLKRNKNRRKQRDESQFYDKGGEGGRGNHSDGFAPDVSTLNYDEVPGQSESLKVVASATKASTSFIDEAATARLPVLQQTEIVAGATVAYKELQMDASTSYQPEVSSYRIGQISRVDNDGTIHLKLTDDTIRALSARRLRAGQGENKPATFVLADQDNNEHDDGLREIDASAMLEPRLVKAPSIEVPNSSHALEAQPLETFAPSGSDEIVVPESVARDVDTQASNKVEVIVANDTPRQRELNGISKEAGFESALDEQLLLPIPNPATKGSNDDEAGEDEVGRSVDDYPHRFRRRSPQGVPTSSDQPPSPVVKDTFNFRSDDDDKSVNVDASAGSSVPQTSSSVTPTQNTVDYPHISQMGLDSSAHNQSSSHQDAQKLSPAPALDLSFTISEPGRSATRADPTNDNDPDAASAVHNKRYSYSHAHSTSEIEMTPHSSQSRPQTTSDLPSSPLRPDNEGTPQPQAQAQQDSFLGVPGYDGQDSSYHESSNISVFASEDSLPPLSLGGVTHSRRQRRTSTSSAAAKRLSPVVSIPAKKTTRAATSSTTRKKEKTPSILSSPDLSPIQISQSQQSQPLSQIPSGSNVVDLMMTSDLASPAKTTVTRRSQASSSLKVFDDDDGDSDFGFGGGRGKRKEMGKDVATGSKVTTRAAAGTKNRERESQDGGIGTKRFLTDKKRDRDNYY
jgi:hypothetical protein